MRDRAFTLIETLAVVAILGLVAGAVLVRAGSATDAARRRAAIADVAGLDALARQRAGAVGGLWVWASADERRLVASVDPVFDGVGAGVGDGDRAHDGGAVFEVVMPVGLLVWLEPVEDGGGGLSGGLPDAGVRVDTRGRSVDYAIVVARVSDGRQWRTTVRGLTGWVTVQVEEGAP